MNRQHATFDQSEFRPSASHDDSADYSFAISGDKCQKHFMMLDVSRGDMIKIIWYIFGTPMKLI